MTMAPGNLDALATILWCAVGSGLGGILRHALAGWVADWTNHHFPLGILLVNASGALLIGLVWGFLPGATMERDFLMLGVLGGYTTVSTYALNTFTLWRAGHGWWAAANLLGSMALCLGAVWLGELGARAILEIFR
jgi:CrcB protein